MTVTFLQDKAKLQVELSEKAILNASGAMKNFLDAYSELCTEITRSDIAKNSFEKPLFNDDLLEIRVRPK